MYELIQVSGGSYYVQSPAKAGLVRLNDTDVCLIDSGSDKDAGRKVRQILDRNGWTLKAIYNTHAHADHIGGNRYLQGQTGCRIYAPGIDCAFTRHPILEPSLLYGGYPPKDLRHKFLMAQDSGAEVLTAEEKKAWIATLSGVTCGSDAFFPFGDNVERARKSGVQYIAEPGGSIRDDNVIETANKYGMVMCFTGMRLFHH